MLPTAWRDARRQRKLRWPAAEIDRRMACSSHAAQRSSSLTPSPRSESERPQFLHHVETPSCPSMDAVFARGRAPKAPVDVNVKDVS
jgi:hypothetical protein